MKGDCRDSQLSLKAVRKRNREKGEKENLKHHCLYCYTTPEVCLGGVELERNKVIQLDSCEEASSSTVGERESRTKLHLTDTIYQVQSGGGGGE